MSAIFRIISFTRKFWPWYSVAGVFVLITAGLNLVAPLLTKSIVDQVVAQVNNQSGDWNVVVLLLGMVILSQIIQIIMQSIGGWIGDIIQVRLQTHLSTLFYQHLLDLHIGFYDNEVTGKTMNKMYRGIEQITNFVQSMLNNFLPFLVTAIMTIILMSFYSPAIAILLTILFPLYILISHGSTMDWKKYQDQQNEISDKSLSRAYETVAGIRVVKAFAQEDSEKSQFNTFRLQIEKLTLQQTKGWHVYDFGRQFLLNIITFAVFAYIVYFTFEGRYTIGEMTLLTQLLQQARFPLFAMSFILSQIQRAEAGSKDFFEVLDTPATVTDQPKAKAMQWTKPDTAKPLIQINNVTFAYEDNQTVLRDLTAQVKANETFALVGASGQGKSTLVNLLLRFYDPNEGSIIINGQNIATVTQSSLRQHIAVVFQESLLFSGTIGDNIRYGKIKATDKEIVAAAQAANAHDFISKLPQGYDSVVGERGVKLSGGQKQRIAIARAILKDAPIIILDEATSALDSESEIQVQQGLEHLMKNRTSIVIAHRLSTIANSDHLLIIADGQAAEYGQPRQLLQDPSSRYSQMVNLQQKLLSMPEDQRQDILKQYDLVEEASLTAGS